MLHFLQNSLVTTWNRGLVFDQLGWLCRWESVIEMTELDLLLPVKRSVFEHTVNALVGDVAVGILLAVNVHAVSPLTPYGVDGYVLLALRDS